MPDELLFLLDDDVLDPKVLAAYPAADVAIDGVGEWDPGGLARTLDAPAGPAPCA
jgi:hypothetical protein